MQADTIRELTAAIAAAGLKPLDPAAGAKFADYLDLILKWNARTNLTAVVDPPEILARHFIECIACAQALPAEIRSLLDFGSGAGFPGIPIAICRPEIAVTLAESQNKKAAFLREAVRQVGLCTAKVFSSRAEGLAEQFDCVTLRAVDRMERAVADAAHLVSQKGVLAVMTTNEQSAAMERIPGVSWQPAKLLPGSEQRILLLGVRVSS